MALPSRHRLARYERKQRFLRFPRGKWRQPGKLVGLPSQVQMLRSGDLTSPAKLKILLPTLLTSLPVWNKNTGKQEGYHEYDKRGHLWPSQEFGTELCKDGCG